MQMQSEKMCTRCQQVLPLTEFYRRRNRNSWASICKTCDKERVMEWRRSGGQAKQREANRRWALTERGREIRRMHDTSERKREQVKRYRATEAGREANRRAQMSPAGRARYARYAARRRMAEERPATLTATEWAEIQAAFQNRCAYCDQETMLTMDHVIPLSKGGAHTRENVVPACRPCNGRKRDRPVETFVASGI